MKIYSNKNVLEAATERIRYLFDEFPNVVVGFSGGKDSTVVFNLTLKIAREKNRLPLSVVFIDQEAEWKGTIDLVKEVMYNPDVKPYWFQIPMVITNNASSYNRFSYCWDNKEKDKWMHEKDPISKKENIYGTDRFHELFDNILKVEFNGLKTCLIGGVRTEEAPKRHVSLTENPTYKWITWGKKLTRGQEHFTFYPIYDWSYKDVWKYIQSNKINYNKVYDGMYRHGVNVNNMRISNLHHETAVQVLLLVQEIEPQTWNKVVDRIDGASSIKHIKKNSFKCPDKLPYMFSSWEEYTIYLSKNIIQEEKYRDQLLSKIESKSKFYTGLNVRDRFWRQVINTILTSDWDWTKLANFESNPNAFNYKKYKTGKITEEILFSGFTSYFTQEEISDLRYKLEIKKNNV
jgi:predicted phosphoadenosine phosphosulfate sulfurtransferase